MKNPKKCAIIYFAPDKKNNPRHFQNQWHISIFMSQTEREGESARERARARVREKDKDKDKDKDKEREKEEEKRFGRLYL